MFFPFCQYKLIEHIEEVVPGGLLGDFCMMTYGCSAVALVAGAGRIRTIRDMAGDETPPLSGSVHQRLLITLTTTAPPR